MGTEYFPAKYRSWRERPRSISVMSGLWGWWRRERDETPSKCDESDSRDDREVKEDGDGEEHHSTDSEVGTESSEGEEEDSVIDRRDIGVPDDSPVSTEEPSAVSDYAEVKELSEAEASESVKEENNAGEESVKKESQAEEVVEEGTTEDHEWSDDDWDASKVPTVTLTVNLRGEEGVCSIEEVVTPLYEPPPCLYSADAVLAPVYSTVNKNREIPPETEPKDVTEEDVYQELPEVEECSTPVPPPIPLPDWDEWKRDVVWRMGRIKRVKKWIGGTRVNNIPNRLSKMLSQDYLYHQGQNGFEDLRRYIKQGGDFCKELAAILQERSEAEAQYGKTLVKLSGKLLKATKDGVGTVNTAWHRIAVEMETQADIHRNFASSLSEEVVKPLKQLVDSQHRIRKSVETAVDKSGKNLAEWRAAETKAKKNSFTCARENEKLRDSGGDQKTRLSASSLHIPTKVTPEKETAKMETKRKKAEECVKKADIEYYSVCLRAERSRLEWESAVLRGSHCFQVLEEERLRGLKDLANSYLSHFTHIGPKITHISDRLSEPIKGCDLPRDLETVINLKAATEPSQEQILPDFYPEHTTLAMNRERRKQALIKLLDLIRSDLERERRGKAGVENLAVALKRTPTFASEDSQQNVQDKLHHMRSMLTYLEAARYKVLCVLSELEGRPRPSHPLADHIHVSRDRQGYQQSVLKVPTWIHSETEITDWVDRGTADGTSVQPDSDFDEFSSQGSDKDYEPVVRIEGNGPTKCRALYNYTANLYDELSLNPGDIINIHDKQPDGWWLGELNGVVGIFPATYVEEIK